MKQFIFILFSLAFILASCVSSEKSNKRGFLNLTDEEIKDALAEHNKEVEWAQNNPLTNQKIDKMIDTLKTIQFPIQRQILLDKIELKDIFLCGRCTTVEEPPYILFTFDNFHDEYILKYKIKKTEDKHYDFDKYYDFQIIKIINNNSN